MLIIWGHKIRTYNRGFAALFCPLCRDVLAMKIEDLNRVSHLYYIPLGQGEHVASRATCPVCNCLFVPDAKVAKKAVKAVGYDFAEFVEDTNPTLGQDLGPRFELERKVRSGQALTEGERLILSVEPFYASLGMTIGNDWGESLRVLGVIVAVGLCLVWPFIVWMIASGNAYISHTGEWLGAALAFLIGASTCAGCFWLASKFGRKERIRKAITRALVPVKPTQSDCTKVLAHLRSNNVSTVKYFTPTSLWAGVQALQATDRAGGGTSTATTTATASSAGAFVPFTEQFRSVVITLPPTEAELQADGQKPTAAPGSAAQEWDDGQP